LVKQFGFKIRENSPTEINKLKNCSGVLGLPVADGGSGVLGLQVADGGSGVLGLPVADGGGSVPWTNI